MSKSVMQRFELSGKVAVITGAGGALCGAMAEALAAIGVKVALLDLKLEAAELRAQAIERAGGSALALACDVLDIDQLRHCLASIDAAWSAPELLINGAGGNDPQASTTLEFEESPQSLANTQSFFELDPGSFRRVFDLNFMGTFLATQVFSRPMVEQGRGAIVNLSSMSAFMPLTKVVAYCAAKAAVSNFTQWLAVHFAHAGVRVNALAPGFFMTEQLRFLHVDPATGKLLPRAQKVIAHTPMGRYGDPDDLVGALIWLLSDASSFVTGVVVPIDGGFSSYSI